MMQVVTDIATLRAQINEWKGNGASIAFVPTMGNLHAGHLALIEYAQTLADKVVASIFVNPMQFGPNEDLASYPKTLTADQAKLTEKNTHLLFLPNDQQLYPDGLDSHTKVTVPSISNILCGENRPGHFQGVATIVTKLFNLVQPHHAIFGEKDYQQLLVIKKMAADLAIPIQIHGVPTKREENGLAMSSRNNYLTDTQKEQAAGLYSCLEACASELKRGRDDYKQMEQKAIENLHNLGFNVDYFRILSRPNLDDPKAHDKQLIILSAAFYGKPRLIDNLAVDR